MATHDIVIRGGSIVDGSGSEPVSGDLAIRDGRISAIGRVDGAGREEIDATGQLVTPGFVDIHTHLDAQIGWDPFLTPVSWHGVTTVLLGNCGVTFAPCKPSDRELLAGMMETVEDIPKDAILRGLPWSWEGFGGYLDALEGLRPAINMGGLVGHCAIRFYVMGERAVEAQATAEEMKQMAELVARSIDEGAIGFSTNRFVDHRLPDGRSIPGTFAAADELLEIARVVGPRDALMQNVFDLTSHDFNLELVRNLAKTTQGRILFTLPIGPKPSAGESAFDFLNQARAGALDITAIAQTRGSGAIYGLQAMMPTHSRSWRALSEMSHAEGIAAIQDADFRERLIEESRQKGPCVPTDKLFWMGSEEVPNYVDPADKSLAAVAAEAGEHWAETFLRYAIESNGRALFTYRMICENIDALADAAVHPHLYPTLGDAGAHVSQVMDAGWPSFVLSYWVRERGLYSVGEAIRRMTSGPARVMGLRDRGVLAVGSRADVNVLCAEEVAECHPEIAHDFPGGAPRFIQRSRGYKATIVNGQVTVLNGEHTGARAGTVLRHPC